jgi:HSP20 family protein
MSKPAKKAEVAPRGSNLLTRFQSDIDRMERLFDEVWPSRWPRLSGGEGPRAGLLHPDLIRVPAVDIYEEGDNVVVKAEIPGARKEDVEVHVDDSMLTIRGEKERKEEVREDKYYRCERSYGSFSRSVELPSEVQAGKATATFTDGVLEVRLPKTEESKRKSVKLKIK